MAARGGSPPCDSLANRGITGEANFVLELEKDIKSWFKIPCFQKACFSGGWERNAEIAPDGDEISPVARIAQRVLMPGSSTLGVGEGLSAQASAASQLVKILIKTPLSLIVKDSF